MRHHCCWTQALVLAKSATNCSSWVGIGWALPSSNDPMPGSSLSCSAPHRGCPLSPADISRAKRSLAGLGTFSSYITRTRKVDVADAKAKRVATDAQGAVDHEEQQDFYDQVRLGSAERAEDLGTPPGFAEQMPLAADSELHPRNGQALR